MFSLFDSSSKASRRHFLRIGTLGLGGLAFPQLLSARASAAAAGTPLTDKSVIFLFQHGGPSQRLSGKFSCNFLVFSQHYGTLDSIFIL